MDCKKAKNLLSSYADNKISEKDKDLLELHLRDCESCREFFYDLKKSIELVKSLEDAEPPATLLRDIEHEIDKLPEKKSFFQRPLWVRIPVEAFSTVMVVLVIFLFGRYLLKSEVVPPGDVSLQKDDQISARWLPDTPMPHLRQTPKEVSEENQEIYEVVEKVREAYRDMGVSFSGEEPEGLEDADEVKKEKAPKISSAKPKPPVSWSSSSDRKAALAKRALPAVAKGKLMHEYDINIEVENLSNGINELTTQVYKNKGVFITPVGGDNISGEQADKTQMMFKIPAANHYRFMWNLEKVGIIKKVVPGGGAKIGTDGFIIIRLMVNVIPEK